MTGSWASSPAVRRSMLGNRSRGTKPELEFEKLVRLLAPDVAPLMRVQASSLPGTPDFAFGDERGVAVFINGCFWHRHDVKGHRRGRIGAHTGFWRNKFRLNRKRDARNARRLRRAGWSVLVVWECRLRVHPGYEVVRVAKAVRARTSARGAAATGSP